MMRKARCKDCGQLFYTGTGAAICQNCSGDTPDNSKSAERDAQMIREANAAPKAEGQTLSVDSLRKDSEDKPKRRKPGPKPKGDTDASG